MEGMEVITPFFVRRLNYLSSSAQGEAENVPERLIKIRATTHDNMSVKK